MAVSSPTGTGSETVTFPGRRLTGCRGWHRFFKLSIYRCGITLKTCSTPRVYILYKKCLPTPTTRQDFFPHPSPEASGKRPCVSTKTYLRLIQNVLVF